ncbi:hypothetical protein [Fulvivirga lutea]|uniref:Uncharacterized protein n=1 Tax=Fulvivirga lutea TaxID=2810512 RepID=A0A974WMI3_9BACT|nr:hypothetical protein [Fulvivirga lutea]QSE99005.1 hypothetical protein JR347_07940 [Fulvivirga lutea]
MSELDVKHYLEVYKGRLEMQKKGITNPPEEIKLLTRQLVEILSDKNPEEEIVVNSSENGISLIDSSGKILVTFPKQLD